MDKVNSIGRWLRWDVRAMIEATARAQELKAQAWEWCAEARKQEAIYRMKVLLEQDADEGGCDCAYCMGGGGVG